MKRNDGDILEVFVFGKIANFFQETSSCNVERTYYIGAERRHDDETSKNGGLRADGTQGHVLHGKREAKMWVQSQVRGVVIEQGNGIIHAHQALGWTQEGGGDHPPPYRIVGELTQMNETDIARTGIVVVKNVIAFGETQGFLQPAFIPGNDGRRALMMEANHVGSIDGGEHGIDITINTSIVIH